MDPSAEGMEIDHEENDVCAASLPSTFPPESFNISSNFDVNRVHPEDVLPETQLPSALPTTEHGNITYNIIEEGTKRGHPLLVDSHGFSYSVKIDKRYKASKVTWRCTSRGKLAPCQVKVIQDGDEFIPSVHSHNHPAQPGRDQLLKTCAEVKRRAKDEVFKSAMTIVEEVMTKNTASDPLPCSLPNPSNLARVANKKRQGRRPKHPRDLTFDLDKDHVPNDFVLEDVFVDDARHLIFSSSKQRDILKEAKTWYCDGTFRIVKAPFMQLYSIHAFVKGEEQVKQVPLVFVLMSRKRKRDYKKVLQCIKNILPEVKLQTLVADFENSFWRAARSVFPDVNIKGCSFHWRQAVWRKADSLGLRVPYMTSGVINSYIKELLALCYIPAEHIKQSFEKLASRAQLADPKIQELIAYIRSTWIDGNMWSPNTWSVFNMSVRTNNDVEGWHRRLNTRGRANEHLYKLIDLLHTEASLVPVQVELVKERKLKRYQKTHFKNMQGRLFTLWEQYINKEIKTSQLLAACSHLAAPCIEL